MSTQYQVARAKISPMSRPSPITRSPEPPRPRPSLVASLLLLASTVPIVGALALMMGLGLERQLSAVLAAIGASAVVLLPIGGLATLMGNRLASAALASWAWPILVLVGAPLYFPGERVGALATGMGFFGAIGGLKSAKAAAALGESLGGALGEEHGAGRPPPPSAPELVEPALPPSRAGEDVLALPYEGAGRALHIDVTFEGKEAVEVPMLFDTGATYTTLNSATLRRLGLSIDPMAPEITLHTANGERQARIALVDRVWLGDFSLEGITIAVCDECGGDDAVGLLGLNVSGQFTTTVDPARHELLLSRRVDEVNRQLDVGQWVEVSATATAWTDGRVNVEVIAENRSARPITELRIGIHCSGEDFVATVPGVPPRGTGTAEVALPRNTSCNQYRVSLDRAVW